MKRWHIRRIWQHTRHCSCEVLFSKEDEIRRPKSGNRSCHVDKAAEDFWVNFTRITVINQTSSSFLQLCQILQMADHHNLPACTLPMC